MLVKIKQCDTSTDANVFIYPSHQSEDAVLAGNNFPVVHICTFPRTIRLGQSTSSS